MSEANVPKPSGAARGKRVRVPGDPWAELRTLIRARLLVAVLALPVGVLLRPEADEGARWILAWALIAVGALSALAWLGVRLKRGVVAQVYGNLGADLLLVACLSAVTGGRASQFVLFFALVVITGGLLGRLPGGVVTAAGACAAFGSLPWLGAWLTGHDDPSLGASFQRPELILAFLAVVGVLSGILGERVGRTRDDLERTARELDRVRIDNDVVLRNLTSGVLTVNAEGRIAYMNPAAEQMLGLRSLEARGRHVEQALVERLDPLRDVLVETLRRGASKARLELMLKGPSGRALPVGVSTNPLVHDGEVQGVVAVFQDLTEVREMERRARRNQTLAELGALAAGIAHELRNGLNPISGSAECLNRELKLEGENAVLMELIVRECSRLNRFVTDLLSYSKERDLAPQTLDLNAVLGELREQLSRDPRCANRIQVAFEARDGGAGVRGDADMLRQVWLNLAANAFEAMPQGGRLVLRCRDGRSGEVMVEFADTGGGIAAEDLPRVGQPFFTTKKGGTGLGLAIAQRIVERHGGALSVESVPGGGTTIRVALPAVALDVAQAA